MYCATSSPNTNTLEFASISSAMASFSASRTVISFPPLGVAYVLHLETAGAETRWKVDRGEAEGEDRRRLAAGRSRRGPTIVITGWRDGGGGRRSWCGGVRRCGDGGSGGRRGGVDRWGVAELREALVEIFRAGSISLHFPMGHVRRKIKMAKEDMVRAPRSFASKASLRLNCDRVTP